MKPFRSVRRSRSENGHRVYDIIGIVLIAAGLITSFSLFRPDTGIIGGVTAAGLRSAFGSGAWAAPVMLILLGLALLLGRREIQAKHLVWGGLAVYLAMLGFI
ncbi:MAG: hypothetical protein IH851_03395, partial [Armatimonadetes bacterium]|nr:hypothetical protein [Armatimonadota bacterium]